jgi:imidazoleglycerol-phosphate dehydratase
MSERKCELQRKTSETEIKLALNLDGKGECSVDTGIGFLDHMLRLFSFHAGVDLDLNAKGDLQVDDHHTTEDIGLTLGQALRQTLGDKAGITRFGDTLQSMDEVLLAVAVDFSGRSSFVTNYSPQREQVGDLSTELIPHFFRSLATEAGLTLHLHFLSAGENEHHRIETLFKGFGRVLRIAVGRDPDSFAVPSTKGTI